jgi:hypothetical protein
MACGSGLNAWAVPAHRSRALNLGFAASDGCLDSEEKIILRVFIEI